MQGGYLVCWKGRRDPEEEAEIERAAERLAIEPLEIAAVGPYAGSLHRHIHLLRKNGPTPEGLPRRPGMAKKRPFGSEPPQRNEGQPPNQ
jgi:16S rRNA (guanine527-N7)-methyltransferase